MRAGWHVSVSGRRPGLALVLASAVAAGGCGNSQQGGAPVQVDQEAQNAYMKKVRESMDRKEKEAATPGKGARR